MKVPFTRAHVFWIPWWDVDHHTYGAPLAITVHTRSWHVSVRPFSGYAQGGDRRGELEWRATGQGPSPYEREGAGKWVLADEDPEIWAHVHGQWLARQYCRGCLARLTDPTRCPEGEYADIAHRWTVTYWRARRRDPRPAVQYCVICLHDVPGCTEMRAHVPRPARWLVTPRHLWLVHVQRHRRCRIREKDLVEVQMPSALTETTGED